MRKSSSFVVYVFDFDFFYRFYSCLSAFNLLWIRLSAVEVSSVVHALLLIQWQVGHGGHNYIFIFRAPNPGHRIMAVFL